MRIDLRYPIAFGLFYLPGFMMLIGAWMLGYSTREAREVVAFMGAFVGTLAGFMGGTYLLSDCEPIWLRLWGGKEG